MTAINIEAKAKGKCRVQVIDTLTGKMRVDTGDFDNTLLNSFFTQIGGNNSAQMNQCYAATDSAVNVTDTTLNSLGYITAPAVTSLPVVVNGNKTTSSKTSVFTFAAGAIVGNLSCIGISYNTSLTGLAVKTLIKDVNGNPTTITVTATDQLVITHTLSITVEQYPAPFNLTIDGVSYSFQFMCSWVTSLNSSTNGCEPFATGRTGAAVSNLILSLGTDVTGFVAGNSGSDASRLTVANRLQGDSFIVTKDNSQAAAGKGMTKLTVTMPANTNFPSNAGVGFVGVEYLYNVGYTYSGFKITPPLPKDSSIAYTFTITFTLAR